MGLGGLFLRKLRAKVSDEPTGFAWVEKDKVAASGFPASRGQIEWVIDRRVNCILTLTPERLPREWVDGLPVEVEHLPMEDHRVPSVETLEKGASFVRDRIREGKSVLVHCLAGKGRTGCVLAAYLIKDRRVEAGEALRILRKVKPGFVEREQEESILEYASRCPD